MTISGVRPVATESIAELDPVQWQAMRDERRRQHDKIELNPTHNNV
jgi:hypothetical protein